MTAEREYACFACGRPCDPDPHGPAWCQRCSGMAEEEMREDRDELCGDSVVTATARARRLRRAGRVPDAVEPRRSSWR